MQRDRDPRADAVLSPGVRRGVAAASFVGIVGVASYLGSPNTSRDVGTALAMAITDVAVIAVLLTFRWLAVRARR
jgi:hypothetical protein